MKYSININQIGIADAGFADKTDLVDWAIIDYIFTRQTNPTARKTDGLAQVNYQSLTDEMPLVGLKNHKEMWARLAKLKLLGLIIIKDDSEGRVYAGISGSAHNAVYGDTGKPCVDTATQSRE